MQSLLSASLQMILSLIFCDVISSSLFRSPTVAPLVARQPFLKIAYWKPSLLVPYAVVGFVFTRNKFVSMVTTGLTFLTVFIHNLFLDTSLLFLRLRAPTVKKIC